MFSQNRLTWCLRRTLILTAVTLGAPALLALDAEAQDLTIVGQTTYSEDGHASDSAGPNQGRATVRDYWGAEIGFGWSEVESDGTFRIVGASPGPHTLVIENHPHHGTISHRLSFEDGLAIRHPLMEPDPEPGCFAVQCGYLVGQVFADEPRFRDDNEYVFRVISGDRTQVGSELWFRYEGAEQQVELSFGGHQIVARIEAVDEIQMRRITFVHGATGQELAQIWSRLLYYPQNFGCEPSCVQIDGSGLVIELGSANQGNPLVTCVPQICSDSE